MHSQWFKKNIVSETPILGAFFTGKSTSEALRSATKHTLELAGSSTAMILFMVNKDMPMKTASTGEHAEYYAGMAGAMALGMMAGAVTFNTLSSVGTKAYSAYLSRSGTVTSLLPDDQPVSDSNAIDLTQPHIVSRAVR